MAEAISVAASLIGIQDLTLRVAKNLVSAIKREKNVPARLATQARRLDNFKVLLAIIAKDFESVLEVSSSSDNIYDILKQVFRSAEEVNYLLLSSDDNKRQQTRRWEVIATAVDDVDDSIRLLNDVFQA